MMNILRTTAAVAALALAATPALAAPVGPASGSRNATATARIIKPLVLTWEQDLDLGTILLSGAGVWGGATVSITHGGVFSCTNVNVTCSGTPQTARYNVAGTQGQIVNITAPNVTLVNQNDNTQTLLMTVSNPGTVTLTNAGVPGSDFNLGGSITVSSATVDGVYLGTFNVTVDY
jgi:hypothetical protein